MTRGRRKDTTLPPSRALIVQRAYRDRKAKRLSDLEDRCRKAEEENERLRKELDLARSGSAVAAINSDMNLERTQRALSLFQQRALGTSPEEVPASERAMLSAAELDIAAILTHTLRQDTSATEAQQPQPGNTRHDHGSSIDLTPGDSGSSECCGGIIDCEGLLE
ncbi:hypothetical protein BC826DRAFT_1103552 [Russula brevipes]|nr:hypothetical protein BC826DRAFT_1103552 [Russula brevipes]